MAEADRLYAAAELVALLKADLLTSRATTVGELKAALIESFNSLVAPPEVISVERGAEPNSVTLQVSRPMMPGGYPLADDDA